MPENTVSVTRPGKWGNLYTIGNDMVKKLYWKPTEVETAEMAVKCFRTWIEYKLQTDKNYLAELKGKNLACFCKLTDCCHADVLLELANK